MILLKNKTSKQKEQKTCLLQSFLQLMGLQYKYCFIWVGGHYNARISLFVEFSLGLTQSQGQTQQRELSSIALSEMGFCLIQVKMKYCQYRQIGAYGTA